MNWKHIILIGLALAAVILLIGFTGGLSQRMDLIAVGTPVTILLVLVVLVINTVYQAKILETLRSFTNPSDYDDTEREQ